MISLKSKMFLSAFMVVAYGSMLQAAATPAPEKAVPAHASIETEKEIVGGLIRQELTLKQGIELLKQHNADESLIVFFEKIAQSCSADSCTPQLKLPEDLCNLSRHMKIFIVEEAQNKHQAQELDAKKKSDFNLQNALCALCIAQYESRVPATCSGARAA